jgi:aspartokinase-like uncharacterized kinase
MRWRSWPVSEFEMGVALRRVVKLGGSLLRQADLADRWRRWYALQSPRQTHIVVGGGGVADAVADIQRIHARMTDAQAHWLCIRAMQLNAELVFGLLPEAEYVVDVAEFVRRSPAVSTFVVDPWSFMQADARSADPLPESWDVSSDSIAARLATTIDAAELVLLKSALPETADRRVSYVDRAFAGASQSIPSIRCVDLSDNTFPESPWK